MSAETMAGFSAEQAENNWRAFMEAAEASGIRPPAAPEFRRSAGRVFAFSDFVFDTCIRHPALLVDLCHSGELDRAYPTDAYGLSLARRLESPTTDTELEKMLRDFRRRELIRIAWRDLCGSADLFVTMAELTALAEAVIDHTLALLYRRQCAVHGVPTGPDGSPQKLVVIGMGKLGGKELNFSSDIDLIFAYPQSGATVGGPVPVSNEEFFTRLCRRLLQAIGKVTADGFVFRVDVRLRPFGDDGPLAMSFDAMEHYYHQQGREWERYAWIKARTVAGDRHSGESLLQRLNPFVYRRYLDFGAFESLRDMKQRISLEVDRREMTDNIKLGRGGIREIEFFGQVFQLIRGGITPALQARGILKILSILGEGHTVPQSVCSALREAYIFLRILEHRLQEFADKQTHRLPENPLARQRLAVSMGYDDAADWERALDAHRNNVHQHFSLLLQSGSSQETTAERALSALWLGLLDEKRRDRLLADLGYRPPASAGQILERLQADLAQRPLGKEGRQRLDKLMPLLLEKTGRSSDPLTTLARISGLIKAIDGRASYFALLLENPAALDHLVRLSSASSLVAAFLTRHPVLLDELLDPRTLYAPPGKEDLDQDLRLRFDQLPDDLDYQMETLRIFKQVNVLRVAAADVTEVLPLMRVSDRLSDIATAVIEKVLELTWRHLVAKHGRPVGVTNDASDERGFAVVAYGKLGGLELGYGSDLDLVFLHSGTEGLTVGGPHPIDNRQFYARLGQRVIHILTSHTRAGILYETDMRLRPSGSSGILVSHIDGFRDYQLAEAWTWEHQALIRARAIGGDMRLCRHFEKIRREVLGRQRDPARLRVEVLDMRRRMRAELLQPQQGVFDIKQDTGGIVDIEFLVQYLVLRHAAAHPELLAWTDNVRLIHTLIESGAVQEYDAHLLKHAYLIYRAVAHKSSLQEKPARMSVDTFGRLRRKVEELWKLYIE
ncbi:MAG: bifunctional [glutamate--ammonia ligase]-adenylyl-L-tyrosine phosphorylase/[glutamate--ammonia-ligase] adenylyltransferase [Desulfobacterales bacterium]